MLHLIGSSIGEILFPEGFSLNETQTESAGHTFSFAVLQGVLSSVLKHARHEINY